VNDLGASVAKCTLSGASVIRFGGLFLLISCLTGSTAVSAPVTFFGEDVNRAGGSSVVSPINSANTQASFFASLSSVGTDSFESFSTGAFAPLTLNFSGLNTAVLSGNGTVVSGSDAGGRAPFSGTQYLLTSAGAAFTLRFSSPVSAFGFYGTDVGDYGGQVLLILTDTAGRMTTLTVPSTIVADGSTTGSALYFGFYDLAASYASVIVLDTSAVDVFGFDSFSVGTPRPNNAVPEPGTYAMLGGGLTALCLIRLRFRRDAVTG
jgi:hypothetical protein